MLRILRSAHLIYSMIALSFLSSVALFGEGFVSGTRVKTGTGAIPIEELKEGTPVSCYDFQGLCLEKPVTKTIKKHINSLVRVTVDGDYIFVAPDHKFYLPREHAWVAAKDLTPDHVLLSHCTELISIDDIQVILCDENAYDITVADYHNFCISQHDIHVHNFIPFVILGVSWAFGAGAGGGLAVTGTLGIGALALGAVLYNSEHRQREYIYTRMELEAERQKPKRPCDPLNPTDTDCYYEDASYHHVNSRGGQESGRVEPPKMASELCVTL
jgi:hypothetical protein